MPFYEFDCELHGRFEVIRPMSRAAESQNCPDCGMQARRIFSPSAIFMNWKGWLPYGKGSYGKMLTHKETGGLDIFVPSFGAMEQDEVDYVAGMAVEKEKERVKKAKKQGGRSERQLHIGAYTDLARRAKPGQRAKAVKEAIKETGDKMVSCLGGKYANT